MLDTLLSVGIGGLIGVAGTISVAAMQNRKDRQLQRRNEVLPVAGRALAAAEETYWVAGKHGIDSPSWTPDQGVLEFLETETPPEFSQSHQKLRVTLHELSLLIRDIEEVSQQLRQSVSFWNARTIDPSDRQKLYEEAREAFIGCVRQHIET